MQEESDNNGARLEEAVTSAFIAAGAQADRDVLVDGNQIDVLVTELTISNHAIRTIVECKDHARRLGVRQTNMFILTFHTIRNNRSAELGLMVSWMGFSRQARDAAASAGLQVLTFESLIATLATRIRMSGNPERLAEASRLAEWLASERGSPGLVLSRIPTKNTGQDTHE